METPAPTVEGGSPIKSHDHKSPAQTLTEDELLHPTQLPCHPLSDERLLRIQHSLRARLHRPRDGPIDPTKDFWDLYELLFRLAIYLGTPEMLPAGTDVHLWWTFHEFCHLRDQLALTAGSAARERCRELTFYQPGPLLTAAGMLIVDEICLGGTLLDGLRYFMHQRRYDPWAGTLWHEFCEQQRNVALTDRVLGHLQISRVDTDSLKPLALWEPGAPHHLHPPETVEDVDLPEAALLLTGEGLRPWERVTSPRSGPPGQAQGRQGIKPIGSF
ncbi:hypothetical protein [Nonomuraea basaltis]|uniref:hypothetical protein n=1 Tax=Nonomuraea basaltis TaxID=2495887 RepID=UPI00110C686E|nr:hypothetical protein [Nonomuraea basaltis]TMR88107.1 hypothetical protein EJK15_68080 [Nonomuraea basaltis]